MAKNEVPALVVESRVKEYLSGFSNDGTALRVAGDLGPALNQAIAELLEKAANRCVANGRSTVRPSDL